jgi:23S rRNA (uracil1939-C5)-methyltransferase
MTATPTQEQRLLTLILDGLGRLGEALAEVNGKPVYVFGGIPGETVVAKVVRERRGYIAAQVVEVLEPSPHRVAAPCPYVGECTGCQWQHIAYGRQLEMKREAVVDALERIGGLDGAIVGETLASPEPLGYRNHARFTISKPSWYVDGKAEDTHAGEGPGQLGYVHREKRRHIVIDRCLLMDDWINEAMGKLQGKVAETTQLSLRHGQNSGDWLLQPRFTDPGVPLASGQKQYTELVLGHTFQVSSPSFFQVNTHQAERMMTKVIDALALTGNETVVDAYAGVATFAVLISDHVKHVIAVEDSSAAVADARVNVAGIANVELREARTEDVLAELVEEGIDAVIVDPPRAGCMPGTINALVDYPAKRLVYVSCDPETLARDLALLTAGPYTLDSVTPVDMFPQTYHVESVSVLTLDVDRKAQLDARSRLVLASSSPRRQDILTQLGIGFDNGATDVEEPAAEPGQEAHDVAVTRALAKARASAAARDSGAVLGADTVVELDGELLGKPVDAADAWRMLTALRGREHRVVTGIALIDAATGEERTAYRASRVDMRAYTEEEIESYIASGDPFDKAGAYAVQHDGFAPASEVKGCYLNVVGLPVCELLKATDRFGLRLKPSPAMPWPKLAHCPECAKRAGVAVENARRGIPPKGPSMA